MLVLEPTDINMMLLQKTYTYRRYRWSVWWSVWWSVVEACTSMILLENTSGM